MGNDKDEIALSNYAFAIPKWFVWLCTVCLVPLAALALDVKIAQSTQDTRLTTTETVIHELQTENSELKTKMENTVTGLRVENNDRRGDVDLAIKELTREIAQLRLEVATVLKITPTNIAEQLREFEKKFDRYVSEE